MHIGPRKGSTSTNLMAILTAMTRRVLGARHQTQKASEKKNDFSYPTQYDNNAF